MVEKLDFGFEIGKRWKLSALDLLVGLVVLMFCLPLGALPWTVLPGVGKEGVETRRENREEDTRSYTKHHSSKE